MASMDILDNVVPYIGSEEEKMEAETLKLARQDGSAYRHPARRRHYGTLQSRAGRRRPHRVRLDQVPEERYTRADPGRME